MAVDVLVPPLGQTVDTMTLVQWYKREGDSVTLGEPLFAIETDKANLDIEALATGILRAVAAQAGDEVQALTRLAVIAQPGEDVHAGPPAAHRPSTNAVAAGGGPTEPAPAATQRRTFISPRARRLALQQGLDISQLTGTGPEAAIVERDVRAWLSQRERPQTITPVALRMATEAGLDWRNLHGTGTHGQVTREDVTLALAPAQEAPVLEERSAAAPAGAVTPAAAGDLLESVPVRGFRAVIAQRMAASHEQTAPVTLAAEADATALVGLRQQLQQDGVTVSYTDLFIQVLARALRDHPRLNATLDGDAIRVWRSVHVGIAVDTERGLLVPVLRNVEQKGLQQIAQETASLITRAQSGQCTPDEMQGGRFTLTNLGMFGVDMFTPIINLPQCAILGIGRIKTQPVMVGNAVVGREMVWLSLTFDHRLVDGAPAARFLQRVVQLIEHPHLLLT